MADGKTRKIKYIESLISEHDRYIKPFFGGGAIFFHLKDYKQQAPDYVKYLRMDDYQFVSTLKLYD